MRFSYATHYFPPAPFVEIYLGVLEESLKVGPLLAFIDTGADATLIPIRYIRQLSTLAVGHKFLRSQWGERRNVKVYRVDVGVAGIRLPAIEVVADNRGDEVIVGRNVLNMLRLRLDGPKQTIEITE